MVTHSKCVLGKPNGGSNPPLSVFVINSKGTPENLEPGQRKGEGSMTTSISFKCTESMKQAVKAKGDPSEFSRQAIQDKLDREK